MTPLSASEHARPVLSVVIPAFNEADNLAPLYARLAAVMGANQLAWEWIVIDDHSSDTTFAVLSELAGRDRRVTGLRLARNVGSHAAIRCGLAHAAGEAAVVLAGDGQDPPEDILRLVAEWRRGDRSGMGRATQPTRTKLARRHRLAGLSSNPATLVRARQSGSEGK